MRSTVPRPSFPDFLTGPVDDVARRLLGCVLEREIDGQTVRVRIVETEAYDETDEASHTFRGKTPRNATMFGPAGHLYVYFTYGMHHCCNVVAGEEGHGAGVLIRAVEPIDNLVLIESRRGMTGPTVTNGPGKVTHALGIDRRLDGHDLHDAPLRLSVGELRANERTGTSPRIGISKARELHRRFYIVDNPYVSRPRG